MESHPELFDCNASGFLAQLAFKSFSLIASRTALDIPNWPPTLTRVISEPSAVWLDRVIDPRGD